MNKKGTIYFVEGLPGNGKTTTSNWLHNILDARFFTENALNYPNDIESQYPHEIELNKLLTQWDFGDEFNTNVSVQHYMTCSLGLVHEWVNTFENTSKNIIMDSVWLQNPINELIFRNADEESILEYCTLFAEAFKEFNLRCIYLKRDTVLQSVEFACRVKGVSWTNRVAELISQTPYGLDNNLHGMDGMIQYFTTRRQIEEKILSLGIMLHTEYLLESNNWERIREQIRIDFAV